MHFICFWSIISSFLVLSSVVSSLFLFVSTFSPVAPEVARGEKYDLSVDVYSFGLIMWFEISILTRCRISSLCPFFASSRFCVLFLSLLFWCHCEILHAYLRALDSSVDALPFFFITKVAVSYWFFFHFWTACCCVCYFVISLRSGKYFTVVSHMNTRSHFGNTKI